MKTDDVKAVSKAIIVDNKNQILLLKPKNKFKWHLPGGHLKLNERYAVGIRREVIEETGLKITSSTIITARAGFQLFLCKASTTVVKLSDEHEDYEWMEIPKALKKLTLTKETAEDISKALKNSMKYPQYFKPTPKVKETVKKKDIQDSTAEKKEDAEEVNKTDKE